MIFKFRFKPPCSPLPFGTPLFPRQLFVCVVVCESTKAAIHSVNTIQWLVVVRQEVNLCISYVVRYLRVELLEVERLYVKAYLCAHLEHSRVTTCTRDTHTVPTEWQ